MPKEQKILCICGIKNSGKTSYIEKLLKEIKSHGKSAAVIKHDGHDFEGDRPGTDTYRYHQAGAAATAIFSKNPLFSQALVIASLKAPLDATPPAIAILSM